MKCSGSRNCDCTGFQPRKTSPKCRACSHPQGDHRESSSDDSSGDSDSSHEDSGRDTKEKTVSALVTNLLEDSNYTGVEVESARNEARAGLTRKRGPQGKPKAGPKPTSDSEPLETDSQRADGKMAKVLGIIMFPYGKKAVESTKFPPLTNLGPLEEQGLVARHPKGGPLTFNKEWNTKEMYSFFKKHLPQPFQYFAESQGHDEQKVTNLESSLPYRTLSKVRNAYRVVEVPNANTVLNGKFYQNHASGGSGSGYKYRYILLASKKEIPQQILEGWGQKPPLGGRKDPKGKAVTVPESTDEEMVQGPSKKRKKAKKVKVKARKDMPSNNAPNRQLKRKRYSSTDNDEGLQKPATKKGKEREHRVRNQITYEPIVISDAEPEPLPGDGSISGEETEHELQPLNAAKRPRVQSLNRTEEAIGLELSASVSSLSLGETSSSTALGAWMTLRKASAPFFADDEEGNSSVEF